MDSTKFNAAQQAEGFVLPAFWGEALRHDYQRLYRLQSRLAILRIRRRIRGRYDKGQVKALLRQCRLARATLRHTQANARALRASAGGLV